jgi:hypothetical protein
MAFNGIPSLSAASVGAAAPSPLQESLPMKKNVPIGCAFAFAVLVGACGDQPTAPEALAPVDRDANAVQSLPERGPAVHRDGVRLSHDFGEIVSRAIDPNDYVCSQTTVFDPLYEEVNLWIATETQGFITLYITYWADLVPQYEAIYFLTEDTPQEFGYNGQYTNALNRTHRDAKRFWDIEGDEIQLLAMKGSMLLDEARVASVLQLGIPGTPYTMNAAQATAAAAIIRSEVEQSQVLNGGNFYLFSANAFAVSAPGFIPDKIIMGDAVLELYELMNFGDVAPQAVYAHEYAHHVQFDNGYRLNQPGSTAPERTRYTELMADAMSAYFLTHKRGAAMNKHRVAEFLEVFFQIGDCAFTNSGHHGTPEQRMRAAEWGFTLAAEAQKQGHILTAEEFNEAWQAIYATIVAPDAP